MDWGRRLRNASLGTKLLGMLALVILIGIGVSYVLTSRVATQEYASFSTTRSVAQAELLAPTLADYYRDQGSWQGVADALRRETSTDRGRMMGPHSMMDSNQMGPGMMWGMTMRLQDLLLTDPDGEVLVDPAGTLTNQTIPSEARQAAGTPIDVGNQTVGWLVAASALNEFSPSEQAFLTSVRRAILIGGAAAALVALLLGGLFFRGLIRPVRQLDRAAHALAAGELEQTVDVETRDEIGRLAASFNRMSSQLHRSEALRRRMIQDIAHELRTPLTVIQGDLQALKEGIYQPDEPTIDSIHEESLLLGRLVEDLRELSLAEAGELQLERASFDLGDLADGYVRHARSTFEPKSIEMRASVPDEPIYARIDPDRIGQVLYNLLNNAARHTPEGGRVTLELTADGREATVRIRDTGPGIDDADLPYVFERFWRGEAGRTHESGSTGLGLAIAKALVEAHGGRIWAVNASEGAVFAFALPLDSAGSDAASALAESLASTPSAR